jgi:hypothetical protein
MNQIQKSCATAPRKSGWDATLALSVPQTIQCLPEGFAVQEILFFYKKTSVGKYLPQTQLTTFEGSILEKLLATGLCILKSTQDNGTTCGVPREPKGAKREQKGAVGKI